MIGLAKEIIAGRRLGKDEDLSFFFDCDLDELCEGANLIRKEITGDKIDLCSIINGRSGRCPEDCKYCAQSAHYDTDCKIYDFLPTEVIVEACKENERAGVDRFSIVTAGRKLSGEEFDHALATYQELRRTCPDIELCASMGFLSKEQLQALLDIGVDRYHHNIETSRNFFTHICSTHTYDQKFETLYVLKELGMKICSGGIIGMGESWQDRLDMALDLHEVGVDSIPLNILMPIKGTPLMDIERISESDVLRTVAMFKYINPEADIRLAAGRAVLTKDGEKAFNSGASATITGNMLTTVSKATIQTDKEMIKRIGRV